MVGESGMPRCFRVIDTGTRSGRFNVALDQALVEARQQDAIPDTIRFLRFRPCVLLGRHQDYAREIDHPYCVAHGIEVGRRITGGGAIYLDEGQLGWELVFRRHSLPFTSLAALSERLCAAVAAGLRRLGVEARFRPRNDLEVAGRKIGGTGGFRDGDVLFFQGTLLIRVDPAAMFGALDVPLEKSRRHALATAAARITSLEALLGSATPGVPVIRRTLCETLAEELGIRVREGALTDAELALAQRLHDAEIGTEGFVREIDDPGGDGGVGTATRADRGGTVTVHVRRAAGDAHRIQALWISGDFFATPPRLVLDLEARLKDVPVHEAEAVAMRFLADAPIEFLSVPAATIAAAIGAAALCGARARAGAG